MQRQNEGNDCGIFAITAATALCNAVDPASVIFEIPTIIPTKIITTILELVLLKYAASVLT